MSIRGGLVPTSVYWLTGFAGAWPGQMPLPGIPGLRPSYPPLGPPVGFMSQVDGIDTLNNLPPRSCPVGDGLAAAGDDALTDGELRGRHAELRRGEPEQDLLRRRRRCAEPGSCSS